MKKIILKFFGVHATQENIKGDYSYGKADVTSFYGPHFDGRKD